MSDTDEKVRKKREKETRLLELGKERDRIANANANFFLNMFLQSVEDSPREWDPEGADYDPLDDQMTAEEKAAQEASWRLSCRKLANVFHRHRYAELYAFRARIHAERLQHGYLHNGRGKFDPERPPIRNSKSWTLKLWNDPRERDEAEGLLQPKKRSPERRTSWYFSIDALSSALDLHFGEHRSRSATGNVITRRRSHRHLWRVPRGWRLWQKPKCRVEAAHDAAPATALVRQRDLIPSLQFLIELWRTPPLSYRARMEARAHVAMLIERQALEFEATLGLSAATARRKVLAQKIEFAKWLGDKPLPSKLIKKATASKQKSRARAKLIFSPAPRPVPTRTKRKRKLR